MSTTVHHELWMSRALKCARKGLYTTAPNPRVGCVIVRDKQLLAEGWHEVAGGPHAEINALRQAGEIAGADVYVTLEPCAHHGRTPPCVEALTASKPKRVIIAMRDPNPLVAGGGVKRLRQAGIEVIEGVLETGARALNPGFISRFLKHRPYMRLKMAASMDGRTALKNGLSQWVTGEAARRDVQFLRARACAVLTGVDTVLADNPLLNVRLSCDDLGQATEVRQPAIVVVDSRLRLTGRERIFDNGRRVWIYTLSQDEARHQPLVDAGADVVVAQNQAGRVDLQWMMEHLASREINELHSECGQVLAGALLRNRLVDELVLYQAPIFLGSQARGVLELGEFTAMEDVPRLEIKTLRQIGEDIRLTLVPRWG